MHMAWLVMAGPAGFGLGVFFWGGGQRAGWQVVDYSSGPHYVAMTTSFTWENDPVVLDPNTQVDQVDYNCKDLIDKVF